MTKAEELLIEIDGVISSNRGTGNTMSLVDAAKQDPNRVVVVLSEGTRRYVTRDLGLPESQVLCLSELHRGTLGTKVSLLFDVPVINRIVRDALQEIEYLKEENNELRSRIA